MQNRNLSRVVSCHPALVLERLAPAQRKRGCLGRGGRGRRSSGLDIAAKTHHTYCHILAAIFMFNFLVLSLVGLSSSVGLSNPPSWTVPSPLFRNGTHGRCRPCARASVSSGELQQNIDFCGSPLSPNLTTPNP